MFAPQLLEEVGEPDRISRRLAERSAADARSSVTGVLPFVRYGPSSIAGTGPVDRSKAVSSAAMAETSQTFRTTLVAGGGNNVGIVVPEAVLLAFDRGKRVPVVVTIDGGYQYRNTTASMGGQILISFNAETRKATGKGAGDEVEVRLDVDDAPRTIEVPPELAAELANDTAAKQAWDALSYSRQRAHAESITGAKTDETRAKRVAKALADLRP